MIIAILVSLALTAGGIGVSAISIKKHDPVKEGMYGHFGFYLYLFALFALVIGFLYGIDFSTWGYMIFVSLAWIVVGRALTMFRLFKQLAYLHLIAGIITFIWIIILSFVQFSQG